MASPLLIAGFTVRAAAQSARRAGFEVYAVDAFGDRDLREAASQVEVVENYPLGLVAAARRLPEAPWMYVGGLENEWQIVRDISAQRQLLGVNSTTLKHDAGPWALAFGRAKAFRFPDIDGALGCYPPETLLWKPNRSAGGLGIQRVRDADHAAKLDAQSGYFQPYLDGRTCSAAFIANGSDARLIGISEQLSGFDWNAPQPFQYAGSFIGDSQCCDREELAAWGPKLAQMFGLRGLFGIDFISGERNHLLEINPRYCASMELYERARNWPLIGWHVEACTSGTLPELSDFELPSNCHGKLVVYANRACRIGEEFEMLVHGWNSSAWALITDLSQVGTIFHTADPVATVFASGATTSEVKATLRQRSLEVLRTLIPLPD